MSQENVEVVRSLFDAVARRDTASAAALYDPEVEWDNTRGPLQGLIERKVYRGHEGLGRWWREYREPWENIWDEVEELIDAGDQVISVQPFTRGAGRAVLRLTLRTSRWSGRSGRAGSCGSGCSRPAPRPWKPQA